MTRSKLPTISVGLCTFNGERFLREQLESIESQTLPPDEVVACDDGSTDKTLSILHEFAGRAPFPVRVIENKERLGVSANFAKAVSECRGDYYAPCDQDDIWLPRRLETFAALLTKRAYGLVFSNAFIVDDLGHRSPSTLWESFGVGKRELRQIASGQMLELLVERTLVTGATMLVSQDLLRTGLPFPENLPKPILQDAWLTLIAAARREIAAIETPLMSYRRHASQQAGLPSAAAPSIITRFSRGFFVGKRETADWVANHHAAMDATLHRTRLLRDLLTERIGTGSWTLVWHKAIKHLETRQHLSPSLIRRLLQVLSAVGSYMRFSPAPLFDMRRDIFYPYVGKTSAVRSITVETDEL